MKEILEKDADYILLRDTVENGFPKDKKHCSGESLRFWNIRDDLSVEDGIILYGNRIVIPRAMKKEGLKRLHSQARIQGGGIWGTCPPLEPNAQRKKSTEIKRLEGTDSAKISKIFKMNFFFS